MNILTNNLPTEELQAIDAAHHLHPFTAGNELAQKGARIVTRAEGVWLTDSDGNRLLDAMAGLWCVNIGYGRDELAEAAAAQMRQLPYYNTFFQTSHIPALSLAKRIADLAPGDLNHVFFASSGSEANDTNIRLVRQYWTLRGKPQKKVIISRVNAYHGSSMGSASLGGMAGMHAQGGMPIPDIEHIGQPHWYAEGGDMDPEAFGRMRARELEDKIAELGEENVAAFIAEPIQGAGGVIIPPASYWPEIQRICDAHEILLIADEVICGFGRTGEWFGSQTLNLKPDMMTIAKGLSSGYAPIGGSVVSDHLAEVLNQDEFTHGYTYSGHPVACAVALENLRIIEEEGLVNHVKTVAAPALKTAWESLGDHPMVGETRSIGLMAGLALSPNKAARAIFDAPVGTVGYQCREASFANGLVMRHVGDRMIISPPLVITPDEIETLVARARSALDTAYEWAKNEGLCS
ncbi:Omega-amino acid--pyruvate aminotransferase [Candidatus Rhodobacter oscarellae]|uniref:Omega-amino acid--pyruvate aminotransferase n=1 Tax=Candidatus Rhodobacter oscarellae TaxID=1675527 RepID=A0A0J9GXY9_9RHOB|nr:aspartate aminotransferase family protein [Candidatus Rhodobacter lobularis]KMW58353.1 Omega-amino acid--pyruvate aminotransferase [Candidatus Rhodobacter lobularis]